MGVAVGLAGADGVTEDREALLDRGRKRKELLKEPLGDPRGEGVFSLTEDCEALLDPPSPRRLSTCGSGNLMRPVYYSET